MRRGRQLRAFSLAEVAMASAVLAIGATAVLGVVGQVGKRRADTVSRSVGTTLAAELMSRITALPLADPDSGVITGAADAGEKSVAQYDNAGDYSGYSEAAVCDSTGKAVSGLSDYSREVTIQWLAAATDAKGGSTPTNAAKITVVVKFKGKPVATLTNVRSAGWENGRP